MGTTQLRGSQILDGSITAADVDDALEKDLTKVRVTTDDLTADFLSSKVVAGTGISVAVVGASGSNQTLRITATGGGSGGGSSLTVSGALASTTYSDVPSTLVFDDGTGFQVEDLGAGVAKITIASHFKTIFVSGSDTLVATGSDSLEMFGYGGLEIGSFVDEESFASGSTRSAKIIQLSTSALSASLANRITDLATKFEPAWYVTSGTSYGQITWVGSSTQYARADHQHGTPPTPSHSILTGRAWASTGSHTGVANSVATWNSSGAATVSTPTANGQVLSYQGGALKWVTLAAGLAFYNEATESVEHPGTPVEMGSIYTAAAGTIA